MIGPQSVVTIQSKTNTSDSMGGFTETWTNLITISGVLTSPRGNEYRWEGFRVGKEAVRSTHIFYCDVPTGVTINELCRLVYGTRIFDIVFVRNPGMMNHHYELELVEIK